MRRLDLEQLDARIKLLELCFRSLARRRQRRRRSSTAEVAANHSASGAFVEVRVHAQVGKVEATVAGSRVLEVNEVQLPRLAT